MLPTHRPPTHPGEMLLKEFLEPLGVSQVEAADRMNIPFQRLNAIVKGRRGVSADTALLFEALTRWDAQIWLTLQAKWDLWHALKATAIVSGFMLNSFAPNLDRLHSCALGRHVHPRPAGFHTARHASADVGGRSIGTNDGRRAPFCRAQDRACRFRIVRSIGSATSPLFLFYDKSVEPNRQRFTKIIGVVDPRVPVKMERFGDDDNPALVAATDSYRVYQVRWPVLENVWGEGLLLQPAKPALGHVIALPDADQTPEQIVGLTSGVAIESQFARRLAENGFEVLVPVMIDRTARWSGHPDIRMTDQPHREWIYRQAFHMGRHVIGYEVQKVLAAVDWFKRKSDSALKVGVAGYAEGGLVAFYAAAADTRIDAALVSGYFDSRQNVWSEPIYRNVWGLLREFGDAELATLVAPRGLVVEYPPCQLLAETKAR